MKNKRERLYCRLRSSHPKLANLFIFLLLMSLIFPLTCCVPAHTGLKHFIAKEPGWPYTNPDLPQVPELIEVRDAQSGQPIPDAYVLIIEIRHSVRTDVAAGDRYENESYRVHVLPFSQVSEFKTKTGNSMGFVWSYKLYGANFEGFAFAEGYYPTHLTKSSRRYFLHAELEGGKTYYVFCARIDTFAKLIPTIVAVKKDSELMQKVPGWLAGIGQAELTDEGIDQLKVRQDEKGKFVLSKPGSIEIRKNIEVLRKQWIEKAKLTGKESLSMEDGV
jgi:hypothetical protein